MSILRGTAVAQWLGCCAGLIPAGVSGFFIDIKSFRSHYGPGIDSASNRNEYQEYFMGVKTAGALSRNLGTLTSWNLQGLSMPVMGLLYFYLFIAAPVSITNVILILIGRGTFSWICSLNLTVLKGKLVYYKL